MSSDRKPEDSGDWIPPNKRRHKSRELRLNPTQLEFLKQAVDKMVHPHNQRRLEVRYSDLSEHEKEDLKQKLENLEPKKPQV